MLIDTIRFFDQDTRLTRFHETLRHCVDAYARQHGRGDEWDQVIESVPFDNVPFAITNDLLQIGNPGLDYEAALRSLLPWRKGPVQVGATYIDTEWRSDWKWQRISPHVSPLPGKKILDIGCGNGYHLFHMLDQGADLALGIDPTILFNYQFSLMQKLTAENEAYLLPLRSEHLPPFSCFDAVFSMGVLYHRRSPIDHLSELFSFLRPGGELILETLVVEGDGMTVLVPEERYAKMGNVWFIPATRPLEVMLHKTGFTSIRTVDVTPTSIEEQRATEWMQFQSLRDFLDPEDSSKTVEGYPAPVRATLIANRPA